MRHQIYLKISVVFIICIIQSSAFCQIAGDSTQIRESGLVIDSNEVVEVFTDSIDDKPNRASMYSAILPGLGQIYNKKYWKLPLIYGGGVVIAYYLDYNNRQYKQHRDSFIAIRDQDDRTKPFDERYDEKDYERATDYWRRNRDLLIISAILVYAINIVDAHVDAHLAAFNMNEDLTINFEPDIQQTAFQTNVIGLSLKIKLN